MSNYTLSIDLAGGDKAASMLDSLVSKIGALGGSGGISKTSAFKVGVNDIAKAFNQASKESAAFEKNLAKVLNFSNKVFPEAFGDFASGKQPTIHISDSAGDGIDPQSIFQKAADEFGKANLASGTNLPPEGTIHGLKEPNYGRALAGLHEMGDIKDAGGAAGPEGFAKFAKLAGELGLVIVAVDLFKNAIEAVAAELKKAFQFASELYSKALTGGLSTQLQAQRQITGSVLGVPADEVNRFKQSTYVMQRLAGAINDIAKDAPTLAFAGVQFKILDYEILRVASNVATKLAPAMSGLAIALDDLLQILERHAGQMGAIFKGLGQGALNSLFGPAAGGLLGKLASTGFGALSAIGNGAQSQAGFNSPLAMMKQLPASTWERMGLVVGGGSNNYAAQTAKNTRDTVTAINKLAKYIDVSKRQKPTWGFNPSTAQP
jgi:hypothetical protein